MDLFFVVFRLFVLLPNSTCKFFRNRWSRYLRVRGSLIFLLGGRREESCGNRRFEYYLPRRAVASRGFLSSPTEQKENAISALHSARICPRQIMCWLLCLHYSRILIGSYLWSIRGQTHRWRYQHFSISLSYKPKRCSCMSAKYIVNIGRQDVVRASVTHSATYPSFGLTSFWRHLWSITEETHGNMEFNRTLTDV